MFSKSTNEQLFLHPISDFFALVLLAALSRNYFFFCKKLDLPVEGCLAVLSSKIFLAWKGFVIIVVIQRILQKLFTFALAYNTDPTPANRTQSLLFIVGFEPTSLRAEAMTTRRAVNLSTSQKQYTVFIFIFRFFSLSARQVGRRLRQRLPVLERGQLQPVERRLHLHTRLAW
jgi:hypothetical protein